MPFGLREMEKHPRDLAGNEMSRFGFRKIMLVVDEERVGGGRKEVGRSWEMVPVFLRTDVGTSVGAGLVEYRDWEKRVDLRGICVDGFLSLLVNECEGEGGIKADTGGASGGRSPQRKRTLW